MIKPRSNLVLIKRLPKEEKTTEGGIHLPMHLEEEFFKAEIVAVGTGQWLECGKRATADDLEPGMTVLVEAEHRDKTGHIRMPHILPVSPDSDLCLVPESKIYAIEGDVDGNATD